MAIKLSKELPTGDTAEYWKILSVSVDYVFGHVSVTFGLYKDHDARVAGKAPASHVMKAIHYVSGLEDRAALYAAISALPEFSGAVSV